MAGHLYLTSVIASLYICSIIVSAAAESIIVTTIEEAPYVQIASSGTGNDRFTGYIPDLMAKLAESEGLEYTFQKVPDDQYGQKKADGSWTGMIGEVVGENARLAAAPMTISADRREYVDFTEGIMGSGKTILIKRPADGSPSINNAQELAAQTKIDYGVVSGGHTSKFFEASDDPTFSKMWTAMNAKDGLLVANNKAGVDKVLNGDGNYAFIMENGTAAYWVNQKPCDLLAVGGNIGAEDDHYAFVLRKDDALKDRLNNGIRNLQDAGELKKLEKKWWPEATCGAGALQTTFIAMVSLSLLARFLY